jgi:phenylalanyl-tRNA synthetase alpha chain
MPLSDLIETLRKSFLEELHKSSSSKELELLKVKYLGKKGPITSLMLELKNCSADERPNLGKLINDLKIELTSHCENSLARLEREEMLRNLEAEWIDVTLPGRQRHVGAAHPISQMVERVLKIFKDMGFSVQLGPDIDSDYYNFGALNFAENHPARDMLDTFYLGPDLLLRTHTSNTQVRVMESTKPPIRVVVPGRTFRNENISARSHVFFHQIEGLMIDEDVTFSDLLATLEEFLSRLFGEKVQTRFRPSYFPFVEPGLEVDVSCTSCKGSGCRLCKQTGWLEILGAGMVHPNVLKAGSIDPEKYAGYAWGMGIERLTMLFSDITDIRYFTQNDLRFLKQFS